MHHRYLFNLTCTRAFDEINSQFIISLRRGKSVILIAHLLSIELNMSLTFKIILVFTLVQNL